MKSIDWNRLIDLRDYLKKNRSPQKTWFHFTCDARSVRLFSLVKSNDCLLDIYSCCRESQFFSQLPDAPAFPWWFLHFFLNQELFLVPKLYKQKSTKSLWLWWTTQVLSRLSWYNYIVNAKDWNDVIIW